jgi:hypothetical protein
VDATPIIVLANGGTVQTSYHSSFTPVELTNLATFFQAPIVVPSSIQPGNHTWFARVTYPSCPESQGLTVRETLEFKLQISPSQEAK